MQDGKASANQLLRVFDVIRVILARPVRAVEQNQRGAGSVRRWAGQNAVEFLVVHGELYFFDGE
jgi:hypothetical protein